MMGFWGRSTHENSLNELTGDPKLGTSRITVHSCDLYDISPSPEFQEATGIHPNKRWWKLGPRQQCQGNGPLRSFSAYAGRAGSIFSCRDAGYQVRTTDLMVERNSQSFIFRGQRSFGAKVFEWLAPFWSKGRGALNGASGKFHRFLVKQVDSRSSFP